MELNLVFVLIAALMTIFSIYLIYLIKKGIKGLGFLIVLYLAGSMVVMFATLSIFFSTQNKVTEAITILANSFYMVLGLFAILGLSRKNLNNVKNNYSLLLFALIMAVSEALMGEFFYSVETKSIGNPLIGVENYYYFGVMATEMLFTLFYFYKQITYPLKEFLIILLPIMIASPVIFPNDRSFVYDAIWISASLMIIGTIIIYETLYRSRLKQNQETMTSFELMIIYTLMMSGEFLYFLINSWYLFDLSTIIGMSWFIYRAIVGPSKIKGNYIRDSKWTFAFIFLTFIMEWFMGGVLDFASGLIPFGISGFISSLSLGYVSPSTDFGLGALFDFLSIISTVTGSVWFLIMMGTEMGMLAVFRIRELKNTENKVRFILMILAYAIYTIYLPSFSPISSAVKYIPYMWSMGLGTLGPVSPSVLLTGIIGTYIVTAILSFLFGARQICSVTCTAPLMYQGTFYDSLKVFNRTSKLARRTLTSKIKPWFKFISVIVWGSLLAMAVISYLDQINVLNISVLGNDPTVFLYSFYFNFLWYVVFISIPFLGTYACLTEGWCSWGTFNQFFGRLGFFRLKVRDPQQCLKCETKDCAKACPAGLTDMPGNFIKSGEFKAFKCVGIGDCVEACPYNNIFFYDVRHKIKEIFKH
ncbi:4Fe-4S dicluster domain-containing protein [Acidianus sulfidivorans JP7]|uniref:4Fe-4S ferredoxin n=1 Tax=Acidianus sulfidivorans JP7 TaxID=619593 RepID=A0A2U9IPG8_9CREN|nr:4Fe-4S binding protein [Acidianus sulfidivorans]AWR97949.1 4Fe-4S dicluster domain-containing protein [Acidianus sulfidivorans JP7]